MRDLVNYTDLRDLVSDCGGIEKFRFFGHLNKYESFSYYGFGFGVASPSDDWVECKIEDEISSGDLFSLDSGYKVKVVPDHDVRYAGQYFYQNDLLSLLERGCFILKTGEGDHIEEVEGLEHLSGDAYLCHKWSEVVSSKTIDK